ncbi:hypothetical protein SUGI_0118120 [Cryptomeria japonica]|nr:hypothetical protein SUGI_0118120 [Cryptomeria japonica]
MLLYGNGVDYSDRRLPSRFVSDRKMPPSEAREQNFLRSLSFESIIINREWDIIPKYTKARTSVEEVMENVMKKMAYAQSRANIVSDMIFNPSNLCRRNDPIDAAASFSRKLMQRVLLLQLRELEPKLMGLALNEAEFETQIWALNGLENEQIREDYCNIGLRFLFLQQRFLDIGMEAFDVLTKLRSQIPHMTAEDGLQETGILRIAVMAGNPGCSAMGSHLFFLQHFPSLEVQTDLVTEHVGWDGIVEAISVKGMEIVSLAFLEAIKHSTCLKSYRIIIFMNALGNNLQAQEEEQSTIDLWDDFWTNLYQNTNAMVLLAIYETCLVWDEIKPRNGCWWFSGVPDEECIHILRKV